MDNANPLSDVLFGRRSSLEVLRCLYESGSEMSGREVARRAGISHQGAHRVLSELAATGVVERRAAPPSHLFRLNREHWAVKGLLKNVFEKENKLLEESIGEFCKGLPRAVLSVVLFGSAAANKMRPSSDIDLLVLVVGEDDKRGVLGCFSERSAEALRRFNHPLAPVVMTAAEFRRKYAKKDPFARNILKTGRAISGKLLTEVL